jgi:hypothetical protein
MKSFLMCLLSATFAMAEDVTLIDGKTLQDVRVVSWGESAVVAKWKGGAGSISYDNWPGGRPEHAPKPKVISEEEAAKRLAEKLKNEEKAKLERVANDAVNAAIYEKQRIEYERQKKVRDAISRQEVIVDMTPSEVIESWGRPDKINSSGGNYGTHEQWVYKKFDKYLYFKNGRLTSWN